MPDPLVAAGAALLALLVAALIALAVLAWLRRDRHDLRIGDPVRLERLTTDDLEAGERVSHFLHGLGTVASVWEGGMRVRFDALPQSAVDVEPADLVRVDTPPSGLTRLSPDELHALLDPHPVDLAARFDPTTREDQNR